MPKTILKRTADAKLPTGILAASILPDASALIAGCLDGVYQMDLSSKEYDKLYAHDSYVSSVSWSANDKTVISGGYDGQIKWYDTIEKKEIRSRQAHSFWSWDLAVSPDEKWIASVTGQYLAGDYKYTPKLESEPSLKLLDRQSGNVVHELPHVPSVQAVAFSSDNKLVAAGNLMGEVRVWDVATGQKIDQWTTPDLTSWGIIKSHSYLGGVFAMRFAPGDRELLVAGMGQMRDPMAGNGKQMWQKWSIGSKDEPGKKIAETNPKEAGEGLMETLAVHPDGKRFVMGGRLRGGEWNLAMFDLESGKRLATLKTGYRITEASFSSDGQTMVLVGANGQPKKQKDGAFPDFGRVEIYDVV